MLDLGFKQWSQCCMKIFTEMNVSLTLCDVNQMVTLTGQNSSEASAEIFFTVSTTKHLLEKHMVIFDIKSLIIIGMYCVV